MRINSVPDVKCFCNNKNVLRAQSMVRHFVRLPVFVTAAYCSHPVTYMNCWQQWRLNDDRLAYRLLYIHTEWHKSHLTQHLALSCSAMYRSHRSVYINTQLSEATRISASNTCCHCQQYVSHCTCVCTYVLACKSICIPWP